MSTLCEEEKMQALIAAMQADEDQIEHVEQLLEDYPEDARLHFVRGSMLIGKGRLIEAHRSLSRAVALAPDYAIARFQLGFFQLTSGEAESALETWGRLDSLPDGHFLRKFVDGLRSLIRDDFEGAITALQQGIELNHENPPLNRDMQLIIGRCRALLAGSAGDDKAEPTSETSLVLSHFSGRSKMH